MKKHISYAILISLLLLSFSGFSQDKKQEELENRRVELRNEINRINALLSKEKTQKKSQLSVIEDVNTKVSAIKNLIQITNQQANLLTRKINTNQDQISALRDELKVLKTNYASLLQKAYKHKNTQSKLMFLLSSQNFKQAYKRIKYINQYTEYQKEQGENLKVKTQELQAKNKALLEQKAEKQKLVTENRNSQKALEKELKSHKTIMASINKNLAKHVSEIKVKQREQNAIDAEIEKIIRDAMASSSKVTGAKKSTLTKFALTPEAKVIAANFVSSKGKLPWPVEKGIVKLRYGTQPHPVVKSVSIQSNGVRIATEQAAKVRAVFKGEVYSIQQIKRGNLVVIIQHGNYFTVYKNLAKVTVKKGEKVSDKQIIGEVFTTNTGETVLSFSVFKDTKTQDPQDWIYKM